MKATCRLFCKALFIAGVLGLLLWLPGCSPTPPDNAPSEVLPAPQTGDDTDSAEAGIFITNAPAEQPRVVTVTGTPPAVEDRAYGHIQQVDVYLDATMAMMGFADTPAVSLYSRFLDILNTSIARSFPDAQLDSYRADMDREQSDSALLSGENLSREAASPSFYLVQRLTHLPDNVQRAGESVAQSGIRMNTFVPSYYDQAGKTVAPAVTETSSPITWAVRQSVADEDRVTLFLTDLHELQLHTGILTQALREHAFTGGNTLGILTLNSEFSGLVPLETPDTVWHEWGALPSGAVGKMLNYGYYTLGLTQEEADRGEETRPFYLICVGRSDIVSDFLAMVQHQLGVSLSADPPETHALVYDLQYANLDPALDKHTRLTGYSQSGVNLSASELAKTGRSYVQLQKSNAGDTRFVEFTLPYTPGANDPRLGSFAAEDFALSTKVFTLTEDGSLGAEVTPSGTGIPVQLSLGGNDANQVELLARLTFPQGVLPKGDYQVELTLTLQPPPPRETPAWALQLSSDPTAQQRTGAFDGSKTVSLEGFLSALSGLQEEQLTSAMLGDFNFPLYVVVDEQ